MKIFDITKWKSVNLHVRWYKIRTRTILTLYFYFRGWLSYLGEKQFPWDLIGTFDSRVGIVLPFSPRGPIWGREGLILMWTEHGSGDGGRDLSTSLRDWVLYWHKLLSRKSSRIILIHPNIPTPRLDYLNDPNILFI